VARWVGVQGQVTSAKKVRKHDSIMTSRTRNPTSKTNVFQNLN